MSSADVKEKVYNIIAEQTGKKVDEINDDSQFIEDLGLDSLDLVELVMAFEEEFGQEIPDEDAEELKTVRKTIDYISKKQGNAA